MVEVDGSDTTVRKTYTAGSTSIAVRTIVNGTENTLNWLLSDHLGSSSITTTADGTWNSEIRYSAFGETRYSSGITPTDYRYTGQLEQKDVNLYYYNARYYDAALGRFVQADTIIPSAGDSKSYDRYAYVNNNPVKYTDPSGHIIPEEIDWPWERGYTPTPDPAPTTTPGPETIGYFPGYGTNSDAPGPSWNSQNGERGQMDDDVWSMDGLGITSYTDKYPGDPPGKRGYAELIYSANPDPSSATALVCMSAASEACMLAIQKRIELGYKTTHLVLIGPTWQLSESGKNGSQIGFSAWADLVTDLLLDGTNILVIYDGSVYDTYPSPEEFTVSGDNVGTYTRGDVPVNNFDKYGYYSVLPHHNGWGSVSNFGANNSPELAASVYRWINSGVWNWP